MARDSYSTKYGPDGFPYGALDRHLESPERPACPKCGGEDYTITRDEAECHECGYWEGVDPDDLYDAMRMGD